PALLTLERGSVRRTLPLQLTAPLTQFALPLHRDDAPNLYLTLHAWTPTMATIQTEADWNGLSGNGLSQSNYRLRTATAELSVRPVNKRLSVTVTPDRAGYAPREEATLTIRVQDEGGNPVRAELSLAVVDEAIYQLSEDLSADLYATFYGKRPLGVATFDSMAPTRTLNGYGGGGGGGFAPDNPRQDFPDTAYWLPAVTTDESGVATITVSLPDTLTSWRAIVKAITAATQVGAGGATLV
ncbi:MAG: hypothetical protein KDE31_14725, partial [Caldilineaceae bacterium]|nr:hypothetical protein [Caldilineaceae bacterium]